MEVLRETTAKELYDGWLHGYAPSLAYRDTNDPHGRRWPLCIQVINSTHRPTEMRSDIQLECRLADALSEKTKLFYSGIQKTVANRLLERFNDDSDHLAQIRLGKFALRNPRGMSRLHNSMWFTTGVMRPVLLGFMDVFADCEPGRQFTPSALAEESLAGINREEALKVVVGAETKKDNLDKTTHDIAQLFLEHVSSERTLSERSGIFRYCDRWFALKTVDPSPRVEVEAFQPLVAVGSDMNTGGQVIFSTMPSRLSNPTNEGEILVQQHPSGSEVLNVRLRPATPISAEDIHLENGYVAVDTPAMSVVESSGIRAIRYNGDSLAMRQLN